MATLDHIGANPEVIQEQPGPLPLVLIHDGGGTALAYRSLGDIRRTLLGIHSPGLRDGTGIHGIRHAADQYAAFARQWLSRQPSEQPSRIIIGGWSLGGTIAIALAAAHPDLVSGVILLDPPPPGMAAMTPQEAEMLIPSAPSHPSGFAALIQTQLKMNAQSLSRDVDRQGGQRALFVGLQAPVYLISATNPIRNVDQTKPAPNVGSCSEWMLSPNRAALAESAWRDALGSLLVGTQRTPGDHFSMFSQIHSTHTTQALQSAIRSIESVSSQPTVTR
ncbi:Alpha/Beta hydrolase protein [Infundibulicybe gibba]|nr:Alpha/Beta hydrolase protein [Infundibulicybe gibba]